MKKFLLCLFILLSFSIFAEKITTDGKPRFDKIIGRKIDYPDTADSFKIIKKGNTYQLIFYGYDTAKKKVAFLREDLEVIYYEY